MTKCLKFQEFKKKYEESCRYIISALKIFEDIPEGWTQLLSNVIELNKDELIINFNWLIQIRIYGI